MELNQFNLGLKKLQTVVNRKTMQKFIPYIASFSLSFLMTQGITFGNYAPFPVAFVSAVPKKFLWLSVFGAIFGYLLPSSAYMPFRYIAAICAVATIRWALSELKKINENQFFAPIISFLPLLTTGITMAFINNSMSTTSALYVAEAFLSAGSAYFFKRAIKIYLEKRYRKKLDNVDNACISVTFAIIILSLTGLEVFSISVGRILMVLMILTCAGVGGASSGAISGIASGAISGLSSIGLSYLSGAYGLGGLMAGIFSPTGKIFSVIAFIIAHGIASLQIDSMTNMLDSVIEVALASVIYMLLPQSKKITEIFSVKNGNFSGTALRNNVVMRLNHSSNALLSISNKVNEISEKLVTTTKYTIGQVYNNSANDTCSVCSLRAICWKKNKEKSIGNFAKLTPILKSKGRVEVDDFSKDFKECCNKIEDVKNSINKNYNNFLSAQKAEFRASNIRDIASEQFKITSAMLLDISKEISAYESFDEELAEKVNEVFVKLDVVPLEISCRRDKFNRLIIECEIEKGKNQRLNKAQLVHEVSKTCGKKFAQACISSTENSFKVQMCQKPILDVCVGMFQQSAHKLCGDSAVTFYDGQGSYIAMVCDGMGTGGYAAVDGAMASSIMESLLKAGIAYETALKLVNSALMSKSKDETLATVDMTSVDLFTGKCELRKAGGTFTMIKRGDKVSIIEKNSLPVGIMQEVSFETEIQTVKSGDIICMLSDGATANGSDFIEELLINFTGINPDDLAKDIVNNAKKNRGNTPADDITAVVIMITDNY